MLPTLASKMTKIAASTGWIGVKARMGRLAEFSEAPRERARNEAGLPGIGGRAAAGTATR